MIIPFPVEFHIPDKLSEVIFVQDFWASEVVGGAELTSDAIIKACPLKLFQLHSRSLTAAMVKKHRNKIWVFGNQTQVAPEILQMFVALKIRYYFFEYDFKPCSMRSTKKHEDTLGKPCECHISVPGKFISNWMVHSKTLFWCSDGQRDKFYKLFPGLLGKTRDFTQSSTFYPETILNIRKVREKKERGELVPEDRWVVLGSKSWIKGTEDAVVYCKEHGMNYVILQGLSNEKFLEELAKSKGLVFLPRDQDVGSRISSECVLLGGKLIANENVLHIKEAWFNKPLVDVEAYLLEGPSRFWKQIL